MIDLEKLRLIKGYSGSCDTKERHINCTKYDSCLACFEGNVEWHAQQIEKYKNVYFVCTKFSRYIDTDHCERFKVDGKYECDRCRKWVVEWLTMDFKKVFNNLKEGNEQE